MTQTANQTVSTCVYDLVTGLDIYIDSCLHRCEKGKAQFDVALYPKTL